MHTSVLFLSYFKFLHPDQEPVCPLRRNWLSRWDKYVNQSVPLPANWLICLWLLKQKITANNKPDLSHWLLDTFFFELPSKLCLPTTVEIITQPILATTLYAEFHSRDL